VKRPTGRWETTTGQVTGIALLFVAAGMFSTAVVEFAGGEQGPAMALAALVTLVAGMALWLWTRPGQIDRATVYSAVAGTWLVVSAFGTLPYLFAGTFHRTGISFPVILADSLFESVSGFSCTGSTVFGSHNLIANQGPGILMYRQFTQWIGGMGIVVLVVTVLPALRASGLGLIGAEAPGEGGDRLAPRIAQTARRFWYLYVGITCLIAVALVAVGMSPFDAVAHAFTTASTGGFSTRDASIGYWDSVAVEMVIMIGLILGGASFTLHSRSLAARRPVHHRDPEFRGYIWLLTGATLVVTILLLDDGMGFTRALRAAAFNVVTLGTSGGFGNATGSGSDGDFVRWAAGPQLILLVLLMTGGCTGSTSGGVKVMRLVVGVSHARRTLRGVRHPRAVLPVRHGSGTMAEPMVERIAGFMVVYGMLVVAGTLVVAALGTDLVTAMGGVVGSLGNMGPALNRAGPTASFVDGFSTPARMVLALLMLVGRLELFPMLLMLVAPYRTLHGRVGSR
tara:strand:+ start:18303 stop:19832 length:1530 start_codon:yes stop_codon:yes gene_type:complete